MVPEEYPFYKIPKNIQELVVLIKYFYNLNGLTMVKIDPFAKIITNFSENKDPLINYLELINLFSNEMPDLFININYSEIITLNQQISDEKLFPSNKNFIINLCINTYYKNSKKYEVNIEDVIAKIKYFNKFGFIISPVICNYDDTKILNILIDKQIISEYSLVLFEFSGGGNLEPTVENYLTIKEKIPENVNIIVACEGPHWDKIARSAIANGDHIRIGLNDTLSVQSNEDLYKKIMG